FFAVERDISTLRVCQRRFKEGFQAVSRADCLRFGMIKRPQIAQWLEELRRQDQGEETGRQRYRGAVVAKIQRAKVGEPKVNRDQRNGQRGEELQQAGGEERQTQHFHGALTEVL